MKDTCIDVRNLSIEFPLKKKMFHSRQYLKAVSNVSFSIDRGTTMGLVGESGCGKTTTGRALLKLYDINPDGSVLFNGTDISRLSDDQMLPFRRKMQMIFQDPYTSLDPRMTVRSIIREPLIAMNICSEKEADEKVDEMLSMVGLKKDHLNRYPHEFSGGQRQRIGIARALAVSPEFIVCDEPISALDVSIQAQVINILEDLQFRRGYTYLFISHDLSMVRHISQTTGVMYLSNIVEYAPTEELYSHVLHPYTESLLSAVPVVDPINNHSRKRIVLQGEVPSPVNPPSGCPFRTRCSRCMAKCSEEKPILKDVGNGHKVACHLYDK